MKKYLVLLFFVSMLTACGGYSGQSEIDPSKIIAFDSAELNVKQDGTNQFLADVKVYFSVFGAPIAVRVTDTVIDLSSEPVNCLWVNVTVLGAEFEFLANGPDDVCSSVPLELTLPLK